MEPGPTEHRNPKRTPGEKRNCRRSDGEVVFHEGKGTVLLVHAIADPPHGLKQWNEGAAIPLASRPGWNHRPILLRVVGIAEVPKLWIAFDGASVTAQHDGPAQ